MSIRACKLDRGPCTGGPTNSVYEGPYNRADLVAIAEACGISLKRDPRIHGKSGPKDMKELCTDITAHLSRPQVINIPAQTKPSPVKSRIPLKKLSPVKSIKTPSPVKSIKKQSPVKSRPLLKKISTKKMQDVEETKEQDFDWESKNIETPIIKTRRPANYKLVGGQSYKAPTSVRDLTQTTMPHIETSLRLRMELLQYVNSLLRGLPRDASVGQIEKAITTNPHKQLGKGTYGTVYALSVKQSNLFVAMKVAIPEDEDPMFMEDLYRESIAMTYLNAMAKLGISPHYPLLYETFLSRDFDEFIIVEELSDGTVETWFNVVHSANELMQLIFQICVAIVGAQTMLGLVNNDVKTNNLFYNIIDPNTVFIYQIYGQEYSLTTNILFKMADWGLASGMGHVLDQSHDHLAPFGRKVVVQSFADSGIWTDKNKKAHIYNYIHASTGRGMSPWKRDYMGLFYILLRSVNQQPFMPTQYLENAVKLVNDFSPQELEHNVGRVKLFQQLFHPNFLQSGGVDSNMFAPPIASNPKAHHFKMSATTSGKPTQQLIHDDASARLHHLVPIQ